MTRETAPCASGARLGSSPAQRGASGGNNSQRDCWKLWVGKFCHQVAPVAIFCVKFTEELCTWELVGIFFYGGILLVASFDRVKGWVPPQLQHGHLDLKVSTSRSDGWTCGSCRMWFSDASGVQPDSRVCCRMRVLSLLRGSFCKSYCMSYSCDELLYEMVLEVIVVFEVIFLCV